MCACLWHGFFYDKARLGAFLNLSQPGDEIPWLNEPPMEIDIGIKEVPRIVHIQT